ncbi:MAG: hypothetical protein JO102_06645 [Elusimicrobia bacterium]|nr:hypothetical protein [Elusimicrobiota bacterium]
MDRLKRGLAAVALIAGFASPGFTMGLEVANTDSFNMNIGGRIQEVAYGELLHDPVPKKDNGRLYLFLKQARLNINGRVEGVKYNTEWVGAAEDVNGSNNGLTLLDFWFDVPVFHSDNVWFRVGQFKVPYGREQINEDGSFQFVERSFNNFGFNLGRDYGAAVHAYAGKFAAGAGVFSGGARDVPLRFLPEHLGSPGMFAVRLGLNDGLDKDLFSITQNDMHPERTVWGTFLSGMYMKDTRIGHSTVLNVRTAEKQVLLNPNWNPYLAMAPLDRATFEQGGWDAAIRGPLGSKSAWTAEAQVDVSHFQNKYGRLTNHGARVQTGILVNKFEAAIRYAVLQLDNDMSQGGIRFAQTPIQEVTPAFSYYMRGHDNKVVVDFPILIGVPTFVENAAGTYVGVEQPDQATVIKPATGSLQRQTVPEMRIMYQLAF